MYVCVLSLLARCSGESPLEYSISTQTRKTHTYLHTRIYTYMYICHVLRYLLWKITIAYIGGNTQNCLRRIRFSSRNITLSI